MPRSCTARSAAPRESQRNRFGFETRYGPAAQQRSVLYPDVQPRSALRMRIDCTYQSRRQVHRGTFRASLLRRSGSRHRFHGPRLATRCHCAGTAVGTLQGIRLFGCRFARVRSAARAGRRCAAVALCARHQR